MDTRSDTDALAASFERTEAIAQALHTQEALQTLLIREIADLNLPADREHLILALIDASETCRRTAASETGQLARTRH